MNKPQIFCFTYAGGTASFFDDLESCMSDFEFVKFEYAGHGERHKESFYQSYTELADDAYDSLQASRNGSPYAIFGYSMGSITLMEVLRRIIGKKTDEPCHLFLAAHEPEPRKIIRGLSKDEFDEWVKSRTIQFGAVPERLLNNKPFWRTYLPIYRADYKIIGDHRFEDLDIKTDIPATVFYSETDTPLDTMKPWKNFFKKCSFQRYDGSHFFINDHLEEMAQRICEDIYKSIKEEEDEQESRIQTW